MLQCHWPHQRPQVADSRWPMRCARRRHGLPRWRLPFGSGPHSLLHPPPSLASSRTAHKPNIFRFTAYGAAAQAVSSRPAVGGAAAWAAAWKGVDNGEPSTWKRIERARGAASALAHFSAVRRRAPSVSVNVGRMYSRSTCTTEQNDVYWAVPWVCKEEGQAGASAGLDEPSLGSVLAGRPTDNSKQAQLVAKTLVYISTAAVDIR